MSDHPSLADLDTASAFVDRHIGPGSSERATDSGSDEGHASDELAARRRARATG